MYTVIYPDGRKDVYGYNKCTFKPSYPLINSTYERYKGNEIEEFILLGTTEDEPGGIPNKMTRQTTIRNILGYVLMEETI